MEFVIGIMLLKKKSDARNADFDPHVVKLDTGGSKWTFLASLPKKP